MASIEDALSQYNQSNFDVGATASLIRQLAQKSGLTEDQLAAAVPVFGDEHRGLYNSGYTEGSNYAAIAQRAVADALKANGANPAQFTQATQGLVSQGADQAQQRWQATQEDDGFGLGTILSVAAIVASFVAPEIAPFLKAGGAAVSFAETGNPLGAVISYAAPAVFGDATASFDSGNIDVNGQALGDGTSSFGNIDVNGQALGDGTSSFGNIDVNGQALGDVPAQAAPLLDTSASLQNADGTWGSTVANSVAGGSGTVDPSGGASSFGNIDVNGQALGDGTGSFGNTDVNGQALGDGVSGAPVSTPGMVDVMGGTEAAMANSPAPGSNLGTNGGIFKFLEGLDPKVQAALAVAGGGLLSGALSGIGNYAATQSKIAADSALADKVSQNRIAEQAAIRNNNKVPGLLNLRPSAANAILRRADGTPYYKQG